jgi:glycosyltransferase involved in cell wall biosynthesis
MVIAASIWCLIAVSFTAAIVVLIRRRLRRFCAYRTPILSDADLPRAAVVLCLRGSDPYLDECLAQLARQDYPDYELRIVLDSPSDPARAVAERWFSLAPANRVRITYLDDISTHTSLKCNALVRGITQLDESVQVVVLADADTVAYPGWLRNMVAPLVAGDVGAVTGSRWYDPASPCWGSVVRFVYNAYSLVPMYLIGAVWPGSLALDRRVFGHPAFIRRLLRAPCEDDVVLLTLREAGLKLLNTPDCIMLNREECDLRGCFDFVRRQLLWTRLSNRSWPALLIGTVCAVAWLVGGIALAVFALATGSPAVSAAMMACLLAIWGANARLLGGLHRTVSNHIARTAGLPPTAISRLTAVRLAVGLLLLIPFYAAAALGAALVRRVRWRGVSYVVREARFIELEKYSPYVGGDVRAAANQSL